MRSEEGEGAGEATRFLTLDELLAVHEAVVERWGGAAGVRDRGLLESALFRPRTGYYADLAEMAAALCESLLVNHAFVDGNKRVAFFATDTFLRLNGYRLEVEAAAAREFLVGVLAGGRGRLDRLQAWVLAGLRPL